MPRLIALLTLMLVLPQLSVAQADQTALSPDFYPSGAHIYYYPDVSNHSVDCQWGFFCEGRLPLYHTHTQGFLHRTDGWAQLGFWKQGQRLMMFTVYVSHYASGVNDDGTPWSQAAFDDLVLASYLNRFTVSRSGPDLFFDDGGGNIFEVRHSTGTDTALLACWRGNTEIEGIAIYNRDSSAERDAALQDLFDQFRESLLQQPS